MQPVVASVNEQRRKQAKLADLTRKANAVVELLALIA
jgi:hypothetical protein